jgi:hypothetical protein
MEKLGPYYIGPVTLGSLRGWILDSGLGQADTVLLHAATLENVMEEYRALYRAPMPDPYFLLGVLLKEATDVLVPENRVVALVDDERVGRTEYRIEPAAFMDDGREVFQCANCGRFINDNGEVLPQPERSYVIELLRYRGEVATRHRSAECCRIK